MKASTLILSMDQESNLFNGHLQTELNSIVKTQLIDLIEEIYEEKKMKKENYFYLYMKKMEIIFHYLFIKKIIGKKEKILYLLTD